MSKAKIDKTFTVGCSGCGALVQVPVTIDPMIHYRCPKCFRDRVSAPRSETSAKGRAAR
jgi:hypothetical protein